jgi:GT2 family glycosyltransferase
MTAEPLAPRVTVVVVTWEGIHLLGPCLRSLEQQDQPYRLLVVDNASTDGTGEYVAANHPRAEVLTLHRNAGFAGGVQAAMELVETEFVALLNNDAVAAPGWLSALLAEIEAHPEAAAVTSRMYLDGRTPPVLNSTGVLLLPTGYGADRGLGEPDTAYRASDEVFGFSGGAALLRTAAVRAVGGFPAPFFLYYEDTDTSWRLREAGWTVRYTPDAVVRHRHAASSALDSELFAFHNERNRLLMLARCAPAGPALRCWTAFLLTTASLAVKHAIGRRLPGGHQFRTGLRLRVLTSALRMLPWALRTRTRHPFWPAGEAERVGAVR